MKILLFLSLLLPTIVSAHGVGSEFSEPLPLSYYLYTSGFTVFYTFIISLLYTKDIRDKWKNKSTKYFDIEIIPAILGVLKYTLIIFILYKLVLNSEELPEYFWNYFVLSISVCSFFIGNFFEKINPFKLIENIFKFQTPKFKVPKYTPVVLLLGLFWLELSSGLSDNDEVIKTILSSYIFLTIIFVNLFSNWVEDGELFTSLFRLFGKLSYINISEDNKSLDYTSQNENLNGIETKSSQLLMTIILLSSTCFDSLKETVYWFSHATVLQNTLGLITLPVIFFLIYYFIIFIVEKLTSVSGQYLKFTYSLLPIAFGYILAHNIKQLFPFITSAEQVWFLEIVFIVFAHIMGVWYSHVIATNIFSDDRKVLKSQLPLAILMIFFTCLTLFLLAQPLQIT